VVGEERLILTDDLETNLAWTVGAPGDAATTGIWAHGNPVGTFSGSAPSNPEDDATPGAGVRCFATGNGSTTLGGDDVDGGPTTLVSPRFDLSGVSVATVKYKRWFANFTTLNDQLAVSISADDGASWVTVETVTGGAANAWIEHSFEASSLVPLTDRMRLRFQTGDQPNDSITEAAVDELSIVSYASGPKLNFYGRPRIGTNFVMHVATDPLAQWIVVTRADALRIAGPGGLTGVKKNKLYVIASGTTPASGLARVTLPIPNDSSLIGFAMRAVALVPSSGQASNVATVTFE
jgi:hypothetical protein